MRARRPRAPARALAAVPPLPLLLVLVAGGGGGPRRAAAVAPDNDTAAPATPAPRETPAPDTPAPAGNATAAPETPEPANDTAAPDTPEPGSETPVPATVAPRTSAPQPTPAPAPVAPPEPSAPAEAAGDAASTVSAGLEAMGTAMVVCACFISCLGVNFQKSAHNMLARGGTVPATQSWRWWLGLGMMISGSALDMAALPFVPMSRIAALGATTMVANVVVTPLFLGERLTRHDIVGCIITVSGTAVACVFGAGREPDVTSSQLLEYFGEALFLVYFAGVLVVLAVLLWLVEGFRRKKVQAEGSGVCPRGGFETLWVHEHLVAVTALPQDPHFPFFTQAGPQFYPLIHAAYAGIAGAQSIMFAKAALTFFSNAAAGRDVGTSVGYLFLFLFPLGVCLWNQVYFLNRALAIYRDALFVTPNYQCAWIVVGIASGLIFYQEYRSLSGSDVWFFSGGVAVALFGLAVLSQRQLHTGGEGRAGVSARHAGAAEREDTATDAMSGAPARPSGFGSLIAPDARSRDQYNSRRQSWRNSVGSGANASFDWRQSFAVLARPLSVAPGEAGCPAAGGAQIGSPPSEDWMLLGGSSATHAHPARSPSPAAGSPEPAAPECHSPTPGIRP